MIWPFTRRSSTPDEVLAVYNAIVAQSRQDVFYTSLDVPDTVTGRFNVICVHMCVVFRRLRGDAGSKAFAQNLFDCFFRDMDRSLRELGVTDVGIPKRIEQMGELFYGLLEKVTEAVNSGDDNALTEVLNRNLYDETNAEAAEKLAHYMRTLMNRLDAQATETIRAGTIDLGDTP